MGKRTGRMAFLSGTSERTGDESRVNITVRPMKKEEAEIVRQIGKRAFSGIERMLLGKPKQACVAEKDGTIVGAVYYKITMLGRKKTAYLEYGFVDPEHQGQGIGSRLYKGTIDYMWSLGCEALTAQVKGDNARSFEPLMKNGFARAGIFELIHRLGLIGMMTQFFLNIFWLCIGMDFYLAVKKTEVRGKKNSLTQLFWYLLVNLILGSFALFRMGDMVSFLTAYLLLLLGQAAVGGMMTILCKGKWKFRMNNGGAGIAAIVNVLSGIFPMCGGWYPPSYEKGSGVKKELGMVEMSEWIFLLLVTAASVRLGAVGMIFYDAAWIGGILLLYRILAVYPFEGFGGRRVYEWNRAVYGILTALSLLVMFV